MTRSRPCVELISKRSTVTPGKRLEKAFVSGPMSSSFQDSQTVTAPSAFAASYSCWRAALPLLAAAGFDGLPLTGAELVPAGAEVPPQADSRNAAAIVTAPLAPSLGIARLDTNG